MNFYQQAPNHRRQWDKIFAYYNFARAALLRHFPVNSVSKCRLYLRRNAGWVSTGGITKVFR